MKPFKLIFKIRSLFAILVLIVSTAIWGLAAILFSWVSLRVGDFIIWSWCRLNLFFFNVSVELKGQENLPKEGCLFVFNHSSHFDILAFTGVVKKRHRYGAKIELFKIPIFGPAMRATGMLAIHRADRSNVLALYEKSISRVYRGESFILAGEGTRQTQPGVGENFKSGPFVFAISGQFSIVPVVIKGAYECLPKGKLLPCVNQWHHKIQVQILPAVSTKGLSLEDRPKLRDDVRKIMVTAYQAALD